MTMRCGEALLELLRAYSVNDREATYEPLEILSEEAARGAELPVAIAGSLLAELTAIDDRSAAWLRERTAQLHDQPRESGP